MVTDEVISTPPKDTVATPAELAAAREGRGLSQVDISQRIKLQVRQVAALEEGRWDALPGKSFVRGALRSYGKLLDIDVGPLLESIGGFAEPSVLHGGSPQHDAALSRSSGLGYDSGSRGSPMAWVVTGLIGVVALVLYFGSGRDGSDPKSWIPSSLSGLSGSSGTSGTSGNPAAGSATSSASGATRADAASPPPTATDATAGSSVLSALSVLPERPAAPPAAPASSAAAPGAAATGASSSSAVGNPSAAPSTSTPPVLTSPAASAAPAAGASATVAVPGAVPANGKGVIVFRAAEDSWIEVRQADGTALHNGLVKAGADLELKGTPPYRVVAGNPGKLVMYYEGAAKDLAPLTRANIARVTLK